MTKDSTVLYLFSPRFEGEFMRGIPQRDLTAVDVDRMTGEERRNAFSPHPAYGTPLYIKAPEKKAAPPQTTPQKPPQKVGDE